MQHVPPRWLASGLLFLAASCRAEMPKVVLLDTSSGIRADWTLVEAPPLSLAELIARAQFLAPQGHFVHAALFRERSAPRCLLVFATQRDVQILELDAASGRLLARHTGVATEGTLERLASPRLGPARALEIALSRSPGAFARLLTFESQGAGFAYRVELIVDGEAQELLLSSEDGAPLDAPRPRD